MTSPSHHDRDLLQRVAALEADMRQMIWLARAMLAGVFAQLFI